MKTSPYPAGANAATLFCVAQGAIAITAFASNSLMCRVALLGDSIDAATFSDIRLLTGATALFAVSWLMPKSAPPSRPDWVSATTLGVFVVLFSFAYVSLTVSTGALVFFGTVQLTLLIASLLAGERVHHAAFAGYLLAVVGLLWLIAPGAAATGLSSLLVMVGAGVTWAFYTLRGMRATNPLSTTTGNFMRAAPICIVLGLVLPVHAHASVHASVTGVILAMVSGGLTSGIGFAVWCSVTRRLTAMGAAAVQLLVPPLAAIGGVLFLHEHVSASLVLSSIAILVGIALTISVNSREKRQPRSSRGLPADSESRRERGVRLRAHRHAVAPGTDGYDVTGAIRFETSPATDKASG